MPNRISLSLVSSLVFLSLSPCFIGGTHLFLQIFHRKEEEDRDPSWAKRTLKHEWLFDNEGEEDDGDEVKEVNKPRLSATEAALHYVRDAKTLPNTPAELKDYPGRIDSY